MRARHAWVRWAMVGVVFVWTATPLLAQAPDDEQQARRLFEQAEAEFGNKAFAAALALYQQAYRLRPLPGFLFNIAQCHRFLGQHQQALSAYRSYLDQLPQAPNRDQTEELIALMQQALAQQAASRPVDGPRSRPAAPAPGEQPAETQRSQSAPASLLAVPPVDQPAPTGRAPDVVMRAEDDRGRGAKDDRGRGAKDDRHGALWLWGGTCLSAALLTTGAITGLLAADRSDEYNDSRTSVERRREIKPTGEALGATSIATLSAGAAVGVATLVYYFVSYRNAAERDRAALFLTGAAVSAVVRF